MKKDYTPLKSLYAFYNDFTKGFPFACESGCSACCTVNVGATSLEASLAADALEDMKSQRLSEMLATAAANPGYTPTTTINRNTWELLKGQEVTEDRGIHKDGTCPLLGQDGLCTIYHARPFACRAMSSTVKCSEGGSAVMEPFLITVNLAMYQIIEHLDSQGGITENLSTQLHSLLFNADDSKGTTRLRNCPVPGFVVPPDEKLRFRSFLRRLMAWETEDGRPLSSWLPENLQIY